MQFIPGPWAWTRFSRKSSGFKASRPRRYSPLRVTTGRLTQRLPRATAPATGAVAGKWAAEFMTCHALATAAEEPRLGRTATAGLEYAELASRHDSITSTGRRNET